MKIKINFKSTFSGYLLNLVSHISSGEQSKLRINVGHLQNSLLDLASIKPCLSLLDNFAALNESDQYIVLELFILSVVKKYIGDLKLDLLTRAEVILNESQSARVKALTLQLLLKGEVLTFKRETELFLTTRSLFSNYPTF